MPTTARCKPRPSSSTGNLSSSRPPSSTLLTPPRAASQIQAICRVRLARRIFETEKRLVIIKNAHPRLLARALVKKPGLRTTFWYKSPLEIKLLYEDYVNLCSRTGFQPPRLLVEKNIAELAKRILSRQNELVTMIQKRWRGLMTRRIIKLYAVERIRLRQWYVSFLMKIQRCYRGHRCRLLHLPAEKEKDWREKVREKYLKERKSERRERERRGERERVQQLYRKERRDEFSCRVLNRIEDEPTSVPVSSSALKPFKGSSSDGGSFSRSATEESLGSPNRWYHNYNHEEEAEGGSAESALAGAGTWDRRERDGGRKGGVAIQPKKKMTLFSQSCYSSDHFKETLGSYVMEERGVMASESLERSQQKQRKEFMLKRISEHGPRGYGRRGYAYSQKGTYALPDHLNHKIFLRSTPKTSSLSSGTRKTKLKKAIASVEPVEYRVRPSTRSQGMSCYHLQELNEIVTQEITRSVHEFQKVNLKEKIESFNQQTAAPAMPSTAAKRSHKGKSVGSEPSTRREKYKYKYPADVNSDPLQWLYDDIDTTIQFQDSQMVKLRRGTSSSFSGS